MSNYSNELKAIKLIDYGTSVVLENKPLFLTSAQWSYYEEGCW